MNTVVCQNCHTPNDLTGREFEADVTCGYCNEPIEVTLEGTPVGRDDGKNMIELQGTGMFHKLEDTILFASGCRIHFGKNVEIHGSNNVILSGGEGCKTISGVNNNIPKFEEVEQ